MGHVGPLTLDNVHNGALVEVRMLDEGMEGSHYTAVVLDVCGARCLVRFEELLAETKPKEKMRYLEEWVHLVQLRYPPARRHVGYNLQLLHPPPSTSYHLLVPPPTTSYHLLPPPPRPLVPTTTLSPYHDP